MVIDWKPNALRRMSWRSWPWWCPKAGDLLQHHFPPQPRHWTKHDFAWPKMSLDRSRQLHNPTLPLDIWGEHWCPGEASQNSPRGFVLSVSELSYQKIGCSDSWGHCKKIAKMSKLILAGQPKQDFAASDSATKLVWKCLKAVCATLCSPRIPERVSQDCGIRPW